MKNILLLFFYIQAYSQDIKCIEKTYTDSIVNENINFIVTNNLNNKVKVFKKLVVNDIKLYELQIFNYEKNVYENLLIENGDKDYFPNFNKDFVFLKPNKKKCYTLKAEDIVSEYNLINNKRYRFKIFIDRYAFGGCNYLTGYIYIGEKFK